MRRTLGAALLACACLQAGADETADMIRRVEGALSRSILWLKMTVSEKEDAPESPAVCSGPAVRQGARVILASPDVPGRIGSPRILMPDGKEHPMELLAHDPDLGLMFLALKEEVKDLPALDPGKARRLELGERVLLVDRRAHGSPEETTCRMVRITCVLSNPRTAYFYNGIDAQHAGALVATPDGQVVGLVGILREATEQGEARFPAIVPLQDLLDSLATLEKGDSK